MNDLFWKVHLHQVMLVSALYTKRCKFKCYSAKIKFKLETICYLHHDGYFNISYHVKIKQQMSCPFPSDIKHKKHHLYKVIWSSSASGPNNKTWTHCGNNVFYHKNRLLTGHYNMLRSIWHSLHWFVIWRDRFRKANMCTVWLRCRHHLHPKPKVH